MLRNLKGWFPLLLVGVFCSLRVTADVTPTGNPTLIIPSGTNNQAGSTCTQAQAAAGSQTTLVVSACGAGQYQYFTYIEFDLVSNAAAVAANNYLWTTTNLSSLQFSQSLTGTAGAQANPIIITSPIKAPTAGTTVTFTGAAGVANLVEGVRVCYYCDP
jgi:hypothetical protein